MDPNTQEGKAFYLKEKLEQWGVPQDIMDLFTLFAMKAIEDSDYIDEIHK